MAKRKGFGQGSGSDIVDASIAANPLKKLPTALQIEFAKALRGVKPIRDAKGKIAPRFKDGGAVPAKFKGFSKLPEPVQVKMNPDLAQKYENGGEVRGARSAISGRGFKGIR